MRKYIGAVALAAFICVAFLPVVPQNDPLAYLQGAESLASGAPMWNEYDHAFVLWPPGYSFLIALLIKVGWSAIDSARIVNAVAFAILFILAHRLLDALVARPALRSAGIFAIVISPLLALALTILSETVFIAIQCALLLLLTNLPARARVETVLLIGVLAGAGAMVRYVGLVGVVVAGIALLRYLPRERRWVLAVYSIPALVPIALWWSRNYALTGTLIGQRGGTARLSAVDTLVEMGAVVLVWCVYWGALVLLALVIECLRPAHASSVPSVTVRWPLIVYAALMLAANIVFGSWSFLGEDNQRLLSSAYVPLLAWFLSIVSDVTSRNVLPFMNKRWCRHA